MAVHKLVITLIILCTLLPVRVLSQTDPVSSASEKVFYNAKIFTANINEPYGEAVSVKDDKIVAVGNYKDVKKTVAVNALQINMNGGFLMPGLIDSHEHAIEGGESLIRANTFDSL